MKILIVEDDKVSSKLIDTILTKNGYETLLAASVQEGISYLESTSHISLIVLDIMMPDEDGFTLLKHLSRQELKMKIPVLMCSAAGDKDSVVKSAALGAVDYIRKPIEPELLQTKVKNIISKWWKTALIVDDEKIIREILKNTLERERFDVLLAESGVAALKLLSSKQVDVVISDIQMPEMSGMDLLSQIKAHYPDLPVIMITGQSGKFDKDDVLTAGADGYINKPFKNIDIIKTVHDVTNQSYAKR